MVLGLLVGAMLALAGGCYQGVFRNPLADPYLLGVAAGAGLGVTAVIALRGSPTAAVTAGCRACRWPRSSARWSRVALTYVLGAAGGPGPHAGDADPGRGRRVRVPRRRCRRTCMQRNVDTIREVYSWLLGRLATSGWHDVLLLLPYAVVAAAVVLLAAPRAGRARPSATTRRPAWACTRSAPGYLLVAAASLGTAAAVSVSGLIGFVGIIVPHTVRLLAGAQLPRRSCRCRCCSAGRSWRWPTWSRAPSPRPAEIPIGVVTAFFGAPFFVAGAAHAPGGWSL